ncbi:MAG: hypothetical protein WA005_02075 [Candidatus Binataceae bacterium]
MNSGLDALAHLLSGDASYAVAAIGFGSGTGTPAAGDIGLTNPAYYKAIGAATFPSSGQVQFAYSLLATDYAASGITITELGLFANHASVVLPAVLGTGNAAWAASTVHAVGDLIVDSNGNTERCSAITGDDKTGTIPPAWNISGGPIGNVTTDNHVTWTLVAVGAAAPGEMIAHVSVPAFPYTGAGNYSGTWTEIM